MSFKELNLHTKLLQALESNGFKQPTEIQQAAIPVLMQGRDLLASAQTGTGKTAAFVLPALQRLFSPSEKQGRGPRVLVLTPTRELAMQVLDDVNVLGKFTGVKSGVIVGGTAYGPQERLLRSTFDLLVATPGRLIDHLERGRIDFSRLELFILDEGDRMLDMGFIDDVHRIAKAMPIAPQTVLFSATLEGEVLKVAKQLLKEPARVQLAVNKVQHTAIEQKLHQADDLNHKHTLLLHILDNRELYQAVVFTATKRGADDLSAKLSANGHACAALHGDMKQSVRKRTIERMKGGRFRVLVATDVAARGLDIKGLSHVVNFDLPNVAEDYIHRIGRTGRGGATGIAVSLVGPQDWPKLTRIERLTGVRLNRDVIEGLEPKFPEPRAGASRGRSNAHRFAKGRQQPGAGSKQGQGRGASYAQGSRKQSSRYDSSRPSSRHSGPAKARVTAASL